jgi:Fic family protein
MALYWPAFEFSYRLDVPRLLPHIAAIEACKGAASTRIFPPQWRERPMSAEEEALLRERLAGDDAALEEIQLRKNKLLITLSSPAQAWVRERFVPGSPSMSLEDILNMHRMVAEEAGIRYKSAGKLRGEGLKVITGSQEIGYHVGAPAERLPRLMDEYIQFINGRQLLSMPAVIHALVAHFFITTIHPFDDGNGRTSRLVSAGILFQRGYNGHGFYALSNFFYENEERYHTILFAQQQEPCPDLTDFVAFGMEALALELRGINNFMKVKLNRVVDREAIVAARKKRGRRKQVFSI